MADVRAAPASPESLDPRQWMQGLSPRDGLTKREWFAGLALQGLLADSAGMAMGIDPAQFARHACLVADAMLTALAFDPKGAQA